MTSRAFTLVETIVVVSITAVMGTVLTTLIVYFYRTNAYTIEQSTAVGEARRGVEDAMNHLREASYGSDGSYPIESAATSSLIFYANVDGDAVIERVTYRLQQGTLYRVVAHPVGNPATYTGATLATTTIAKSVINNTSTPMFRYYDSVGTELTTPINISNVALIKTTVVVDVNTARAPVSYTLSGGATLRNLRDQL
jgi:type II secretory pathway pseudopilin PulG